MLTSQINPDVLGDPATHAEAARLVGRMGEGMPSNAAAIPTLLALASIFVSICEDADMDPSEAFAECAEAVPSDGAEQYGLFPSTENN